MLKKILVTISAIAASLAVIAGTLKLVAWLGFAVIALIIVAIVVIWFLRKRSKDKSKSYYESSRL